MKATKHFIYFLLSLILICNNLSAQESTRVFENGKDTLIVYSDVPGLQSSEFYKIRVRSKLTNSEWQDCFALITRSLWSEQDVEIKGNYKGAYFTHLKDWSHSYANIEMKGEVEIELSKANGEPINKAVVHPLAKGIATTIRDGKVYFSMQELALIHVDIDGQMDDQDTGAAYDGPPIHTVSVFATPIMDKPSPDDEGVMVVQAGDEMPDHDSYDILWFGPGIHNIGREFTVRSFKKYYIPGDAFVLGTFTNVESGFGKKIKIYGVGTISGDSIPHPEYDPEYPAEDSDPDVGTPWKPIGLKYAEYTEVEGVCVANPAFHAIYMAEKLSGKHTSVKWAKVLQWRLNGDGIGNAHLTEDCFIRTQDDGCYLKGDKRRNVFWNDANCATFNLAGMPKTSQYPLIVEDNDVLYARNLRGKWVGSRVFSFRAVSQLNDVDVTFNKLRIEDKFVTLGVFHIFSTANNACMNFTDYKIGGGINGNLTFKNIRAASRSTTGYNDIIWGHEGHEMSGFTFQNVVIDGKLLKNLDDMGCYNEYVTNTTFNPEGLSDDVSLADLMVNGISVPEFSPEKAVYNILLPDSIINVPNVRTFTNHDGAGVETTHASAIPGTTLVKVTAANNTTTKTYTLNFTASTGMVDVTSVSLSDCPSDSITIGEKIQLLATVYPFAATNRKVIWSSSNTGIVSIDSLNGMLTAIAPGKATITVTTNDGGYKDECEVKVVKPHISVKDVNIGDCPSGIHQAGDTFQLAATVLPDSASDKSVTWTSSDTLVATVDSFGFVTTHSMGNAFIRVTANDVGFYDECIFLVDDSGTTDATLIESETGIRVYPNPVSEKLFLDFPSSDFKKEIKIYNTLGQILLTKITYRKYLEIDVTDCIKHRILLVEIMFGDKADFYKVITI